MNRKTISNKRRSSEHKRQDDQQEGTPPKKDIRKKEEAVTEDKATTGTTINDLFGDTRHNKNYVQLGRCEAVLTQPRPRGVAARCVAAVTRLREAAAGITHCGTARVPFQGVAASNFRQRGGTPR